MKISNIFIHIFLCISVLLGLTGCNEDVTEFGFDGQISGKVQDQAGNIVAGDITSNNLLIRALGQGDAVTMDMRVKGDGTFQNIKLYPKPFKIWVTGPVTMLDDTLRVDFSNTKIVQHNFVVKPFVTVKPPVLVGSATSTSISVSYEMTPNDSKVVNLRQLYCSTVPYPNSSTGSGPQFETKTVALTTDAGNATVTGLNSKTKYYLRIGARTEGSSALNYSDQIEVTTP
jgi:hypothetical protein